MTYTAYLYDPDDPAEIADAPASFDLDDPLLADRLQMERAFAQRDDERAARFGLLARRCDAVYHALLKSHPLPGNVELSTSATHLHFVRVSEAPANVGDTWSGYRSPNLSRLKLVDLSFEELNKVLVALWSDQDAWTRPCYGHVLTPPTP